MPLTLPLRVVDSSQPATVADESTFLPQWGLLQRTIHRLCRRSRATNTLVAAIEMRLDREELLSLPQYMALCPTGQCNALCGFCSVTTNRTGIIKKQLPFEALSRFTGPVSRVMRMYGLEGNGEPTLYERFDDLAAGLLQNGATAYLITNGDRLTPETIDALVARRLDSVNFSLNAATAPTHRRTMKLRDFDRVLRNIRRFVTARATAARPIVSVSMVVTRDNVHEVVDFLELGDDLGVDRVLVRPLSEIATEHGAVEDLRPLVPFESEITDMLEGVRDYLASTPRKAQIEIVPENFRAVRPDPPGVIPMPPEDVPRLAVPRAAYWRTSAETVATWTWNAVTLTRPAGNYARILESDPLAVPPHTGLLFRCTAAITGGDVRLAIGPQGGPAIASVALSGTGTVELHVPTGSHTALSFWVEAGGPVEARLGFERLRTPSVVPPAGFTVPHRGRWEIANAGVSVEWNGSTVRLEGITTRGPYLLKSYSIACTPQSHIELPLSVDVTRGQLGMGILSANQQAWLETRAFSAGEWSGTLPFDTGDNDHVHVVLYGERDGELAVSVDWSTCIEPTPARLEPNRDDGSASVHPLIVGETATGLGNAASPPSSGIPQPALPSPSAPGWIDRVRKAIHGDVKYYCQKPWTDLHNFTVDGRMDVCCIATGESQTRYALGNLLTQSFQQVWNGPVAREFRRTVNSGTPLPPCRRCPMAFAYQGPLFNPSGAQRRAAKMIGSLTRLPLGRRIVPAMTRASNSLISHVLFRGFKR